METLGLNRMVMGNASPACRKDTVVLRSRSNGIAFDTRTKDIIVMRPR